jgi:hypothetical protein
VDISCKACKWWDSEHPRIKFMPDIQGILEPGFCRKHRPGSYTMANAAKELYAIGIQPITDAAECCAEFREIDNGLS